MFAHSCAQRALNQTSCNQYTMVFYIKVTFESVIMLIITKYVNLCYVESWTMFKELYEADICLSDTLR